MVKNISYPISQCIVFKIWYPIGLKNNLNYRIKEKKKPHVRITRRGLFINVAKYNKPIACV